MGSPLLPTRFYRHLPTSGEADPLDSVDVKRIDGTCFVLSTASLSVTYPRTDGLTGQGQPRRHEPGVAWPQASSTAVSVEMADVRRGKGGAPHASISIHSKLAS